MQGDKKYTYTYEKYSINHIVLVSMCVFFFGKAKKILSNRNIIFIILCDNVHLYGIGHCGTQRSS